MFSIILIILSKINGYRLSQGHARLMFHDKVEILDAIYAITLVDIAMNEDGRILNCNLNNFPTNPDDEYEELMVKVLTKLNLMEFIKKTSPTLENVEIQSKFFKRTRSDDDVDVDRKKLKNLMMIHWILMMIRL